MSVLPAANHLRHFPAAAMEFRRRRGQATLNVIAKAIRLCITSSGTNTWCSALEHKRPSRAAGAMALVGHQERVVDVA